MFVIVDRKTNKLVEKDIKSIDEARERQRIIGVDTVAVKFAADWKGPQSR
jgi:hypothetical protein